MTKFKVDNAIIMAAGKSSRFAPLSYEKPKGLLEVKGDVLIERQIKQLHEVGIEEIIVVTGYKSEAFEYLIDKYGITLLKNTEYETKNNFSSLYVAREYLKNTYIVCSDNYFVENPFEREVAESYYATVYVDGETDEWCPSVDEEGYMNGMTIGGEDCWILFGHAFFDKNFSKKYVEILETEYDWLETQDKYWEDLYVDHIEELQMKARQYPEHLIQEFDSLEELYAFDPSYLEDSRSTILKAIAKELEIKESEFENIRPELDGIGNVLGIKFITKGTEYQYLYEEERLTKVRPLAKCKIIPPFLK